MELIDKAAVVAEIENLLDKNIYREIDDCVGSYVGLYSILWCLKWMRNSYGKLVFKIR